MRRRDFINLLGTTAAAWPFAAWAQHAERMRHIGALMDIGETDAAAKGWVDAFETGLNAAGWHKGRNCEINYRWGASDPERLARNAQELVQSAPDVFLVHGTPALIPLRKTNTTIPIVFTAVSDPVGQGFAASLAHPGGNITGFSNYDPNIGSKWLQVLKDVAPAVTDLAVMFNPHTSPYNERLFMPLIETAAPKFGVIASQASVLDEEEIHKSMEFLSSKPGGGLIIPSDPFVFQRATLIASLAISKKLPAIYAFSRFAHEGGLVAYGVDMDEQLRQAASYVGQILNGDKAGELPVQTPTRYTLTVNLKTAKALGLSVPLGLLNAADEVIE